MTRVVPGRRRWWSPVGSSARLGSHALPEVGQVVAFRDRRAWRVLSIDDLHFANWHASTVEQWEQAGRPDPLTWEHRDRRVFCEPARHPSPSGKDRRGFRIFTWSWSAQWWPLRDPWPECVDCGKLWPCPCDERNDDAAAAMARLEELAAILPGCCWSCGKPITSRQFAIEFDGENLLLPGAGPAAFHTAGSHRVRGGAPCRMAAMEYEQRWVSAAPGRRSRLTCAGVEFRHAEDYECSAGADCPGPNATHRDAGYCTTLLYVPSADGEPVQVRPQRRCLMKGCRGTSAD